MASSNKGSNHLFKVQQSAADAQKKPDHQTPVPEPERKAAKTTRSKPAAKNAKTAPKVAKTARPKASVSKKAAASKPEAVKPKPGEQEEPLGHKKLSKRQDPDYFQVGFWLTRETSASLDMELAMSKKTGESLGDRSDIVEKLLREWIASRISTRS